ncbi:hypothetical protein KIN20_007370 [Parelaphostrongylus tenuis]|uniref:Nematode cuticle collagen N-terminal domain-containing protein n=1 Tax=Parelaphostrongylus tenuis TaxID=148309 RepID=A0AAD5MPL5_PARTN|nr:hypothetical protein KIN20_007370 [Parelaphostrongylus tenuis]
MNWIPGSRQATFTATVISTVSIIAVIVGLPIVHMHIQKVTSFMLMEVDLCKVSACLQILVRHFVDSAGAMRAHLLFGNND